MYLEVPEFRRCCCCLPLRRGVIAFGYINLVIAILMIAIEVAIMVIHGDPEFSKSVITMYNGVAFVVQSWVAFMIYALEIVFSVILLYGGHKRDSGLLKAYSYYGIATVLATFVIFIIMTCKQFYMDYGILFQLLVAESCFTLTVIGIKIYLLLLIRSELKKLERNKALRFTSKAFDEEGNLTFIDI